VNLSRTLSEHTRRNIILVLLCVSQFMVVLDFAIVNVALPSIQRDLGFSQEGLQWVLTACILPFGGFLLLGGRAADLYGRKKVLVVGLVLFAAASLVAGLAISPAMLLVARAAQGVASAMVAPAALSLLTTIFREGPERDRALGVYGAVLSFGFVAGVILGGLLTAVDWRLTMFINVPVGVAAAVLILPLVAESRDPEEERKLDAPGAVLGTGAVFALIYGISEAEGAGWLSPTTIGSLVVAVALGTAFLAAERHSSAPLAPPEILGKKTVWGANLPGLVTFGAATGVTFILTLYMQQALGYGPLETGLAFALFGATAVLAGAIGPRVISRLGATATLVVGLLVQAASTLLLVLISPTEGLAIVLIGTGLIGVGHVTAVVAYMGIATSGLPDERQGLAGSLANVAQQVGSALGVAILAAVSAARAGALRATDTPFQDALVSGSRHALAVGAALLVLAALLTLLVLGRPSRGRLVLPAEDSRL